MSKKVMTNIDMDGRNIENVGNIYDKPTIDKKMDGLSPFRELSYEEYNLLSDEEKYNGTIYCIKDINSNGTITGYTAGTGIDIDKNKAISVSDIRKNYIDNSDFSINQTGTTEYTEAGYTVDRWYIDGGIVTVADKGVVFTNTATEGLVRLRQDIHYPFEHFAGKTLTLSAKINGEVHYSSGTIPTEKPTNGSGTNGDTTAVQYITYGNSSYGINLNYSITGDYFVPYIALVYGQEINIEWMKLEIGSKTTPYVEPDYKTELLKVNSMNDKGEIPRLSANNVPYDNSKSSLTSTTVQDAVDEIGTVAQYTFENTDYIYNGKIIVQKCGKMCILSVGAVKSLPQNENVIIVTLPENLKPIATVSGSCQISSASGSTSGTVAIAIGIDGGVRLYNYTSTTTETLNTRFIVPYFCV